MSNSNESSALTIQATQDSLNSVQNAPVNTSISAFTTYKGPYQSGKPYCKHCKRTGHSFDNCYSRHDAKVQRPTRFFGSNWRNNKWRSQVPDRWRNNGPQGSMAQMVNQMHQEVHGANEVQSNNPPLQQQIDTILKILEQQQLEKTSVAPVVTMTHAGISEHINWIVDSGASDHMTFHKSILINYVPFISPKYVEVAIGFKTYILGKGDVILNNRLKLLDVLYIPNLNFHLFSVRKFTIDNQCLASFSPSEVLFQETTQGRRLAVLKFTMDSIFLGQP